VDVVDVLGVPAALELERWMQDHHAAAVYDETDLPPPEGTVKTLGEVGEDRREEISGERDVVDGLERRTGRDDDWRPWPLGGLIRHGQQPGWERGIEFD
jgi:hypothetical protein